MNGESLFSGDLRPGSGEPVRAGDEEGIGSARRAVSSSLGSDEEKDRGWPGAGEAARGARLSALLGEAMVGGRKRKYEKSYRMPW